jgi:hypothetical protein
MVLDLLLILDLDLDRFERALLVAAGKNEPVF